MRNTKKILGAAAAAALLGMGALTGCGASDAPATDGADAGPAGLHTPGTLNVCVALSYEPLEYYENGTSGEVIGWDVDSARALGALWGVDTKVNVMNFDGLIPGLQSGKCDLVWSGMYVNEDRVQVTDAVPVLQTGTQVILRKDIASGVTKLDDLCGLSLAAQTATEDEAHVKAVSEDCVSAGKPEIKITGYPGSVDAIPGVQSGKLDGLVDTTVLAATIGAKNDDLVPIPNLFPADYWFGAFTDKGSKLSPEVESGIHELIENGTMAKLAEQYGLNADDVAKVNTKAL